MGFNFNVLIFALIMTVFFSCNDDEMEWSPNSSHDCEFVENLDSTDGLLDDTERDIISNCSENAITTRSEIATNLLGEWELVGFSDGWQSNTTQPCGYITIMDSELVFEFHSEYLDTISFYNWEIENNWLKVTPEDRHLSMTLFCEEYMHGSFSEFGVVTFDVDEYIYKKVK